MFNDRAICVESLPIPGSVILHYRDNFQRDAQIP